jgi:hypothetical protein
MADVLTIVNGREYLLGDLAHVGELTWEHGWPYGCLSASWTLDLPPDVYPAALMPRADHDVRVEIWDGPVRVWAGYLTEPVPGETWTLNALGWYAAFGNVLALTADESTTSAVPDVFVPAAITRAGLPVTIGSTLSSVSMAAADETIAANTVLAGLDQSAALLGHRWMVDADYVLTMAADPTTATLVLDNDEALRGVADDDYVTDTYPRYVSAVSGSTPTAWGLGHVASTSQPAGRRERAMDITDLGYLPNDAAANVYAQAQLDLNGSRMGYTNGLTVRYGDLLRLGGSPRRLGLVKGRDMFRSFNVADASGQVQLGASTNVVIGKSRYRDGEKTIDVQPVDIAARTFVDTLRALKPVDEFDGTAA